VARKRPCRICRRWFQPHPRAGERQKVCSAEACQRARHRRADNAWHARNPDYDKKRRLREAAGLPDEAESQAPDDPLDAIDWSVVERAVGPKPRTAIEGVGRLLVKFAQDAVPPRASEEAGEGTQQLNTRSQDAVPLIPPTDTGSSPEVPPSGRKTQSAPAAPDP